MGILLMLQNQIQFLGMVVSMVMAQPCSKPY
jgi:hypothetical protein